MAKRVAGRTLDEPRLKEGIPDRPLNHRFMRVVTVANAGRSIGNNGTSG